MRSLVLLLDKRSGREAVSAFRFTLRMICMAWLACGLLGCATRTTAKYEALLVDKTVPSELQYLESLKMPSVSLRGVSLGRACLIMTVFTEDLDVFQTGALIESDRVEFAQTVVTLSLENTNLAEYYDTLCLAVGGVWWVSGRQVYVREKNPPKSISASEIEIKDPFDPR